MPRMISWRRRCCLVAAVEPIGDGDRLGWVGRHVRVEQVEPDSADVGSPDPHRDRDVSEVDDDLDPGGVESECVRVDPVVAFLLPSVAVEQLMEVPLGVQQPDADERNAQIGARLEVVAGEHAEPTRVLRERFGDAELG